MLGNVQHSDKLNQPYKREIQKKCGQWSVIQGLQYNVHIEKAHRNTIRFFIELKDKRIAICEENCSYQLFQ